jgi:Uncharacterized MobA-related protein
MNGPRHAAILLAAGASRRLGTPKQLLTIDGEPLVRRAARAALATEPVQALVVLGANADAVFATVADLGLTRVDCADWDEGLAASLRAGIRALRADIDGVLIVLCDQPALSAMHLWALVAAWREAPVRAVASAYAGVLGVPALLPRAWFAEVLKLAGDHGARELLRAHADKVSAVPAPALSRDIDRPEDLGAPTEQSVESPLDPPDRQA